MRSSSSSTEAENTYLVTHEHDMIARSDGRVDSRREEGRKSQAVLGDTTQERKSVRGRRGGSGWRAKQHVLGEA